MAKIEVNNAAFEITRQGKDIILNDSKVEYDLIKLPNGDYHLLLNGRSYTVSVNEKNTSTGDLSLTINGRKFESHLQNKLAELLKSMGMETGKKKLRDLKAPMPGLVLAIKVTSGEAVKAGQELIVLEAMKMENAIKSPQDGVIDSISAEKNDKVEKNQILLSFK